MILGVVGTLPFDRLVRILDDYAARHPSERVVVQIAASNYRPRAAEYFAFRPRDAILDLFRTADVVVAHAGMGTIIDASTAGAKVVLVPRLSKLKEHVDDHQLQIAELLASRYGIPILAEGHSLDEAIRAAKPIHLAQDPTVLGRRIAEYVDALPESSR